MGPGLKHHMYMCTHALRCVHSPTGSLYSLSISQDSLRSGGILIKFFKGEVGRAVPILKMVKLIYSDTAKVHLKSLLGEPESYGCMAVIS